MLNAAILGFGAIASGNANGRTYPMSHASAYEALPNRAQVVAIADTDPLRLTAAAGRFPNARCYESIDTLFSRETPDIVSICLPEFLNCGALVRSMAAGVRGVWCEKPVAVSRKEIEILETALLSNIPVQVNFWRAFVREIVEFVNNVRSGKLGRIHAVSGYYAERFVGNGSHMIALLREVLGPLKLIDAHWRGESLAEGDGPVLIFAEAHGEVSCVLMPIPRQPYNIFEMDLLCEHARVRIELGGRRIRTVRAVKDQDHPHLKILGGDEQKIETSWNSAFVNGLENLIECVEGGGLAPISPLTEALEVSRFLADIKDTVGLTV